MQMALWSMQNASSRRKGANSMSMRWEMSPKPYKYKKNPSFASQISHIALQACILQAKTHQTNKMVSHAQNMFWRTQILQKLSKYLLDPFLTHPWPQNHFLKIFQTHPPPSIFRENRPKIDLIEKSSQNCSNFCQDVHMKDKFVGKETFPLTQRSPGRSRWESDPTFMWERVTELLL